MPFRKVSRTRRPKESEDIAVELVDCDAAYNRGDNDNMDC